MQNSAQGLRLLGFGCPYGYGECYDARECVYPGRCTGRDTVRHRPPLAVCAAAGGSHPCPWGRPECAHECVYPGDCATLPDGPGGPELPLAACAAAIALALVLAGLLLLLAWMVLPEVAR